MAHFRKRFGAKILLEVNDVIIEKTCKKNEDKETKDSPSGESGAQNKGQLIVEAPCAPQDIRFRNDVGLLNEVREKTDLMIDTLVAVSSEGMKRPRTYDKKQG